MRRPRRGLTAWLPEWFWWKPRVAEVAASTPTLFEGATPRITCLDARSHTSYDDARGLTLFAGKK